MQKISSLHLGEVIAFLEEIVIKFEPFVKYLNTLPVYAHLDINPNDPKTFPYYRMLDGDASIALTPIYGFLPDNETEILLTKENLEEYPNMRAFYRRSENVKALIDRYPDDQFLVKRIINPVRSIDEAIEAKNFTLLFTNQSDTHLNNYERDDMIFFLQYFLERFDYRWYINTFEYEDLYPFAHWAMIWNLLPYVLMVRRVLNIRTSRVHPFHIWEHLTSIGFGSYRGYLTREQEMFLYRNGEYLKHNVGKKFLITILGEVFLSPIKYSLSEKIITCSTLGREDTHDKVPEILSVENGKIDFGSSIAFENFLTSIFRNGSDPRNDLEYQNHVGSRFSSSCSNNLYTKFIELVRSANNAEMMLMMKFILDTIVFLAATDKLSFRVPVQSKVSNKTVIFETVTDALNAVFYCIYARSDEFATVPFSKYTLTSALAHSVKPEIPVTFNVDDHQFFAKSYASVDEIVDTAPYVNEEIISALDLSDILGGQYVWLFSLVSKLTLTYDSVIHEVLTSIYRTLVPEAMVINVPQVYSSYEDYFDAYPIAKNIIDEAETPEAYTEIIYAIFEAICPLARGFATLAQDDENATVLVHKLKELFGYLTSYNVSFITPEISRFDYYELPKLAMHLYALENTRSVESHEWGRNFYDYSIQLISLGDITLAVDIDFQLEIDRPESDKWIIYPEEDLNAQNILSAISSNHTIYITNCGVDLQFITEGE